MMPPVARPYSAGNAPVISSTDDASRGRGLAEDADAFGKYDAVEPELQGVVLAADMELAERILHHARHLQNELD